jgi:hypothetical protein
VTRLSLIELEHKIAMLDAERVWVRELEREIVDGGWSGRPELVPGMKC